MQFGVGSNDDIEIADDIDTGRNAFKISRQRIFSGESFDFGCSRGIQKTALDIFGRQKRFPDKTRNFKSLVKMFRPQFTAVTPSDQTFQNIDQSRFNPPPHFQSTAKPFGKGCNQAGPIRHIAEAD